MVTSEDNFDMAQSVSLPSLFSTILHCNFISVIQILASIFHSNYLSFHIYVSFGISLKLFFWDQVKLKKIKTWNVSKGCLSLDSRYLPLPGQSRKCKMLGRVKYSDVWKKSGITNEIYFGDCVASLLSCPNISGYLMFASTAVIFSNNGCTNWWGWNPGLARESHERLCFAFSVSIVCILMVDADKFYDPNLKRLLKSG